MKKLIALYGLAALAAYLFPTAPVEGVTLALLPLAAIPAIASGIGAIGGLVQGARRQGKADDLNNRAMEMAEQDFRSRQPLRGKATDMLMGDQPQAPQFRSIGGGQASDFSGVNLPGMSDQARTAQGLQMGALHDVSGGMDRGEIASMRFQNLLDQSNETRKLGTERIGQDAARLGRIGMGGVSTSLGNLEERIQTGITRAGRDLAAEAAAGDINDRFNRLGAVSGVAGQLRDQDFREGSTRADLALARGQVEFGQEHTLRNEERGERATERDFFDRDVSNRFGHIDRLSGIGFAPPPTGTMMAGSAHQQNAANQAFSGAGNLLGQYLQFRGQQAPGGGGTMTNPGTFTPVPPFRMGG